MINKAQYTSLLQIWDYGISKKMVEGWNVKRGMIMDNDKVKAIFQVLEKSYGPITISRINRGPLIIGEFDYSSLFTIFMLIRDYWSWYKGRILFFAPYLFNSTYNMSVLRLAGFRQRNKSKWISSYIDLSLSVDELRKKLHGKWRNQLKKAENSDLEFVVNNSVENFNILMEKYDRSNYSKHFNLEKHTGPSVQIEGLSHWFGKGSMRRMVLDSISMRIDPGEVVLLTFTNRASDEMRDRLRKRISKLKPGPISDDGISRTDPRIRHQGFNEQLLTLLEDAPIGTIDSFFNQLISPYRGYLGDFNSKEGHFQMWGEYQNFKVLRPVVKKLYNIIKQESNNG